MYQTTKMFGEYVQKDSRTFKARIAYGNTTIEVLKILKSQVERRQRMIFHWDLQCHSTLL